MNKNGVQVFFCYIATCVFILCFSLLPSISYSEGKIVTLKIKVDFKANLIFSKYDVRMWVDNTEIAIIPHGKTYEEELQVTAGKHVIDFYKEDNKNVMGTVEMTVWNSSSFSCRIAATRGEVQISNIKKELLQEDENNQRSVNEKLSATPEATSEFESADYLKGRGFADIAGLEPNYIGIRGYATVYTEARLEENSSFQERPWKVPVYEKDGDRWSTDSSIDHKSKVSVIGQDLQRKNAKEYEGFLQVRVDQTGETVYLRVQNFSTKDYWNDKIVNAIEAGYCLARFKQSSKYNPIMRNGTKVKIQDETYVLLPPRETYFISVSDRIHYSVHGIIYQENRGTLDSIHVFFNSSDLDLIY